MHKGRAASAQRWIHRCKLALTAICCGRCNFSKFARGRNDRGENTSASCGTTSEPKWDSRLVFTLYIEVRRLLSILKLRFIQGPKNSSRLTEEGLRVRGLIQKVPRSGWRLYDSYVSVFPSMGVSCHCRLRCALHDSACVAVALLLGS